MSSNPIYDLFQTHKSLGPFFVRMMLSAVFFLHGTQKAFGWFGGRGWSQTIQDWSNPEGLGISPWLVSSVILIELLAAVALFLGFLTRIAALGIVVVMASAIYFVHADAGLISTEFPFALLMSGIALMFMGGGRFSVDRGISNVLMPSF